MLRIYRRVILFVVLAALAVFILQPMRSVQLTRHEKAKIENKSPEISFAEMQSFLGIWSQYMSRGLDKKISDVSMGTDNNPAAGLPQSVKNWLIDRGWNPNRFYYVEARLKTIVKTAYIKQQMSDSNENLRRQLEATHNESVRRNLMQLIEEQNKKASLENVTPAELEMVSANLTTINEILEGKATYKP